MTMAATTGVFVKKRGLIPVQQVHRQVKYTLYIALSKFLS